MLSQRLEMRFTNAGGRITTISVENVREDVTPAEVQAAVDAILARNIFTSSGGDLVAAESARIVSTEITEIPLA